MLFPENNDELLELREEFKSLQDRYSRLREKYKIISDSEELNRITLTNISDAVYLTDSDGNFVFVCPNVDIIFGYNEHEIMSMVNIKAILGEDKFTNDDLKFQGEVKNLEYNVPDKNGRAHDLLVNVKDVSIRGATRLYVCRDVTEKKSVESAFRKVSKEKEAFRQNLEIIFRSIPEAIITVDADMRVISVNNSVHSVCGLSGEITSGRTFNQVFDCADSSCRKVLESILRDKSQVKSYQTECKGGRRPGQIVELSGTPLLDEENRFTGAMLIIKDVTRLAHLERELQERVSFRNIIGKSKVMRDIYSLIENLAQVDATVLVEGESGAGKELVAEALHYRGARAEGPLVKVNCSALSENLLESELFGHVRGAFTGAVKSKIGRIQAAQGGTLFLDEVGDISPRIQLKLLRFLERKEYERVGEFETRKADVRILAASNVRLLDRVRQGVFREDLYYRLNVMSVALPPLRDRREDIPLLVDHFMRQFCNPERTRAKGVSEQVMAFLLSYHWPGNVRELKHAIEHACILCPGPAIRMEHLPSDIANRSKTGDFIVSDGASAGEKESILAALERCKWNKTRAARALGVSRMTLYRKLEKFDIDVI